MVALIEADHIDENNMTEICNEVVDRIGLID